MVFCALKDREGGQKVSVSAVVCSLTCPSTTAVVCSSFYSLRSTKDVVSVKMRETVITCSRMTIIDILESISLIFSWVRSRFRVHGSSKQHLSKMNGFPYLLNETNLLTKVRRA
jgi:hypothetical protein